MNKAPSTIDNTNRLFLALWPDSNTQNALANWRNEWAWPSGTTLVRSEKLHLTLYFLGNVPGFRLSELVQEFKVPFHAFDLNFSRPKLWKHGLTVLEPDSTPSNLLRLRTALGNALNRLNLHTESRTFRPHITLAHHVDSTFSNGSIKEHLIQWHVRNYALIETLQTKGGGYSIIHRYG